MIVNFTWFIIAGLKGFENIIMKYLNQFNLYANFTYSQSTN